MTTRISILLCACLICSVMVSSSVLAQTRTTPVEVQNTATVEISPANNLVQTQVKSLKVLPLTTAFTVAANSSAYLPEVTCTGYKEARVVIFSNVSYTFAQNVTVTFQYDSVPVGLLSWYAGGGVQNHCGLSPICTTFTAVVPVMGDTLKIKISNGNSDSAITINPASCWVYLVN